MGNVWDATKLMLIIYGMTAAISFLVAWVIKLTFAAIRMHSARGAAALESPAKAPAAKRGP
jgi:cytosine/uracil/thiamine/allantoin permease